MEDPHLTRHTAITRAALERSVVGPLAGPGVYPEAFLGAYGRWLKAQKAGGRAPICEFTIDRCLAEEKRPPTVRQPNHALHPIGTGGFAGAAGRARSLGGLWSPELHAQLSHDAARRQIARHGSTGHWAPRPCLRNSGASARREAPGRLHARGGKARTARFQFGPAQASACRRSSATFTRRIQTCRRGQPDRAIGMESSCSIWTGGWSKYGPRGNRNSDLHFQSSTKPSSMRFVSGGSNP